MIVVRSWIYTVVFLTYTLVAAIICLPTLLKSSWALAAIRTWVRGIMWLARTICGITCRVEGREHLPVGPCIVAAQHQSSFETYRLFLDLAQPVFVLKKELLLIPFVGWYILRSGLVPIDRGGHAKALRKMLRAADAALAAGKQVVIFPQGTRTMPGTSRAYLPGVAGLYAHCDAPVIPLALNSGYLWGKTRVLKEPGEIIFRFLPPMPRGLSRENMLNELRSRLDAQAPSMVPPGRKLPSGS
ncbi:MAG: 1-acyl-sn-glycerol-3-phosphate acyltransferase [Rhodobacteraceae bacterium]|nr:1-acyl-sn-glycerol-3-phosphate acyltransferase [Paracoccaceae bacterium]